ncbi:hypothetical protein Bca52824_023747 [Brassica carinata]|uniref:Uncharacterized protein n=1 Tax=Brassica carinata TaxID=52824 RepID=A0A8X8ATG3_BRACI|nr:hypothetical protein Bca52824_023747 [Brassica carinata]
MDGVLDLSALLQGRLQLLPKKKSTVGDPPGPTGSVDDKIYQEGAPKAVAEGVGAKHKPKKKGGKKGSKKTKANERATEEQRSVSFEGDAPADVDAPPDEDPKVSKKKKGKEKKRPREMDFAGDRDQENVGRDLEEDSPTETAFEGQRKKKTKKKSAETDVVEREDSSSAVPLERKRHRDMTGSDGSMNYLVERYDRTLKQTMVQLGAFEKLARLRLSAIERMKAEQKKAEDKDAEEREVFWVKFEELENKLKSDRAAKKELARKKARLEQANVALERERDELLEERDAAVEKLIRERKCLRDSRSQEVTRKRTPQGSFWDRSDNRPEETMVGNTSAPADPMDIPLEYRRDDRPEGTTVDNTPASAEQEDAPEKSVVEENAGMTREEGEKSACPEDLVEFSDTSSEEQEEEGRVEKMPSRPLSESNEAGNVLRDESSVPLSEGGTLTSTVDPPAPLTENTGDSFESSEGSCSIALSNDRTWILRRCFGHRMSEKKVPDTSFSNQSRFWSAIAFLAVRKRFEILLFGPVNASSA